MGFESLRALASAINFANLGVAATVTRPAPDDTPITTTAIWTVPSTEMYPVGTDFGRREARLVLALPRADVPTVPRGTQVVASEPVGGDPVTWVVDGTDRVEPEHVRVVVRRA